MQADRLSCEERASQSGSRAAFSHHYTPGKPSLLPEHQHWGAKLQHLSAGVIRGFSAVDVMQDSCRMSIGGLAVIFVLRCALRHSGSQSCMWSFSWHVMMHMGDGADFSYENATAHLAFYKTEQGMTLLQGPYTVRLMASDKEGDKRQLFCLDVNFDVVSQTQQQLHREEQHTLIQ